MTQLYQASFVNCDFHARFLPQAQGNSFTSSHPGNSLPTTTSYGFIPVNRSYPRPDMRGPHCTQTRHTSNEMGSSTRDDVVLSDSEYYSALSRPSTPLELELDTRGNVKLPATSGEMIKKRLRRDTGLPYFRFPRRSVDQDVEKIEDNVNQLLRLGETLRDEVDELKRDAHPKQETLSTKPETSTSTPNQPDSRSFPRPDLTSKPTITLSIPPASSPEQVRQGPPKDTQETQTPNLHAVQQSLNTIRSHLTALESAINVNITTQLHALGTSNVSVLDTGSLPSFKVEKKNRESAGAVLNTVKIACAVERGLEALVAALEVGTEGDGREKGEGSLMEACLRKPEDVAVEMHMAVLGMRKVLKSTVGSS